ncbi:DNA polymerase III subunit beta [Candidatus Poribacteria bacterium]|nr:DNA polymerase III subunit beta [Candidatus Poribacteria bacterium]
MELVFKKEDLLKSLQVLQGVAAGRNTLPILSNVLIRAANGQVEIVATDLEVGIRIVVPGTIFDEGAITISAKKLAEIVRELPPAEIKLTTTANDRVEIVCGEGVYKIIGLPDDEFPDLPAIQGDFFTIDGEGLRTMIYRTEFSAATEETRYFLNGLYFHLTPESTQVVATDGRRLAIASSAALTPSPQEPIGVIIPLKGVKEITKTFAESAEVKICLLENQIMENFLSALKRVALLANPKTYSIRLDIQENAVKVSAKTPELGEAYETVELKSGNGDIQIAFDARFLMEAVRHIQTEDVLLELKDSLSAVVLKPVGDDTHLCLIMPMRLES